MSETALRAARAVPRHLPSLDGLRAISIAMVLFSHATSTVAGPLHAWFNLGQLGVRIFFVISGFLITTLLLDEHQRTGTISLAGFYLRRAFRIFPAFYVFILVVVLLTSFGLIGLRPGDLRAALTYTMNYHHDRSWYLGHTWSLSVEEQFYLIWPAVLLLAGVRRGLLVAAACVVLAPLARVAVWVFLPGHREGIGESFITISDALATGCLLAGASAWLSQKPAYLGFLRTRGFVLVPVCALVLNAHTDYIHVDYPLGETLMNLAIALSIDRWVRFPSGLMGRALNHSAPAFIGRMSYSLYLWQQLFMAPPANGAGWLVQRFPFNLACAFLAAYASYMLVEQPCLRFYRQRAKARPRALTSHVNLLRPG